LKSAVGSSAQFIRADLSSKGNIHFKNEGDNNRMVACIVEVNK